MAMYNGDKTERLNLRLTKMQYDYLIQISDITGMTPSDYIRSLLTSSMLTFINNNTEEGKIVYENNKASINDKL